MLLLIGACRRLRRIAECVPRELIPLDFIEKNLKDNIYFVYLQ